MLRKRLIISAFFSSAFSPVNAEVELSFFGGLQSALPSDVTVSDDRYLPSETNTVDWVGRSLEAPLYYGIRATVWDRPEIGYGVDFTHSKIYAKNRPAGYDRLNFSDGLNTVTVNAYRRWGNAIAGITPYVGGGFGMAIPHVEVSHGGSETSGYQITGPAATFMAGASYPISDQWSLFGEYKGTLSANTGDLNDGGTISTDVLTNAVNVGVSFSF